MAYKFVLLAAILAMMTSSYDARKMDVTVEYFSSVLLRCQNDSGEVVDATKYSKIFWITAEALVVDASSPPSSLPSYIKLHNITHLEVTRVDDDQFGYYTCVMITQPDTTPMLTRWGVNIDGADYSKLEEQYKDSAVIGAIAAAVMLVLVGGGCIIWHFRYNNRLPQNGRSSIEEDPKELKRYQNEAFDSATEMKETKLDANGPEEKFNGTTSSDGGVENERM